MLCSGLPFLTTAAGKRKRHDFIVVLACKRDWFVHFSARLGKNCVAIPQNIMLAACSFPLSVTLLHHVACAAPERFSLPAGTPPSAHAFVTPFRQGAAPMNIRLASAMLAAFGLAAMPVQAADNEL
ncbi:MAG: hypothetical protein IKX75_01955, partial [Desulfovibrio sp.]|nr:hypothetical protein [Desulfovibrio sp.]